MVATCVQPASSLRSRAVLKSICSTMVCVDVHCFSEDFWSRERYESIAYSSVFMGIIAPKFGRTTCSLNSSWLVVWHINFIFPLILGCCHHPNWRTIFFQRGKPTTNQLHLSFSGGFWSRSINPSIWGWPGAVGSQHSCGRAARRVWKTWVITGGDSSRFAKTGTPKSSLKYPKIRFATVNYILSGVHPFLAPHYILWGSLPLSCLMRQRKNNNGHNVYHQNRRSNWSSGCTFNIMNWDNKGQSSNSRTFQAAELFWFIQITSGWYNMLRSLMESYRPINQDIPTIQWLITTHGIYRIVHSYPCFETYTYIYIHIHMYINTLRYDTTMEYYLPIMKCITLIILKL